MWDSAEWTEDQDLMAQLGMTEPDCWDGDEFAQMIGAEPPLGPRVDPDLTDISCAMTDFGAAARRAGKSMDKFAMSVASTHEPVRDVQRGLRSWSVEASMVIDDLKMHNLALGDDAIDIAIVMDGGVTYTGRAFVSSYAYESRTPAMDTSKVSLSLRGTGPLTAIEREPGERLTVGEDLVIGPKDLVSLEWNTELLDHTAQPGGGPPRIDYTDLRERFMTRGLSR